MLIRDLISLTKPRVISLLLVTTIAPMFLTDRGLPPLSLVLWVTLAGYLMAGGANAINMWFDRDIDVAMARTRLRPIPAGRLPAAAALLFGLTLGAVAFALFWRFAFPLGLCLAVSALLLVRLNVARNLLRDNRTALADLVLLTPLVVLDRKSVV